MVEPKIFQCSLCPFYATYDRYDSNYLDQSILPSTTAKNKKEPTLAIDLLENVYLLRDPFIAVKDKDPTKSSLLIIGGTCSICSSPVCMHADCRSILYTKILFKMSSKISG